jgi:hypothetical protein
MEVGITSPQRHKGHKEEKEKEEKGGNWRNGKKENIGHR